MPPNSISLEFNKMPTVTVDGQTHKFQADKAGGYQPIPVGGVTYSLVKDKASGRYTMNITGEPAALEKYNFTVGKGRVTEGKFGGDSMEDFFKRTAHVGEGKGEEHYADFSFAGGHLKDKVSFLQSGAWGLDPLKAHEKLQKLNEEAEAAAKKSTNPKPDPGVKPQVNPPAKEKINGPNSSEDPTVTVTSNTPLNENELALLKAEVSDAHHDTIDRLVANNDTASLRQVQSALTTQTEGREAAHRILSDKANALYSKGLSPSELAQKTEANLAKLGLKANPTKGDGNCFFHAVAHQVGGGQGVVRTKVALAMNDVMTRAKHIPRPRGIASEPTEESHENTLLDATIAGDKAWGEDVHCAYVARAFDRPVILIGPDNIRVYEKDKETDTISNASQLPKNAILLSHKGLNHWESASRFNP